MSGRLVRPWFLSVWPGMGSVALTAGTYLTASLDAEKFGELPSSDFFEVDKVEIKDGVAHAVSGPSCDFYGFKGPSGGRDLLFFVGESQPAQRGLEFCRYLLEAAAAHDVQRVFTFAAMATQIHPAATPRVFGAVNQPHLIPELEAADVQLLREGQISGLNGVMLAAASEFGLEAICLLGEMPFFALSVPNPKASMRVLEAFSELTDLELDLTELNEQSQQMERSMVELMERVRGDHEITDDDMPLDFSPGLVADEEESSPILSDSISQEDTVLIERLFLLAREDRSEANELKSELDRLGLFSKYEDRFLDLFKKG